MTRPLALLLLAATLAACSRSQPEPTFVATSEVAGRGSSVARETLSQPVTAAPLTRTLAVLALPVDAGRPGRLRERLYANGWRQVLPLEGDGDELSLDIRTDAPGERRSAAIPLSKPTQESVRREILARFPTMPMRIVARPMNNALGPFGLAIGAGPGGLRCAFAWQWVDDLRAATARAGGGRSFFGSELPASVRLRLCRRGVTADQLASWFEQLDIDDVSNLERIVEAARSGAGERAIAASEGARAGGEIVDPATSLESTLIGGARSQPAVNRAARHQAGQRRAAPRAAPQDETPAPLTTPMSPNADGRQYLAPVAAGAPQYAPPAAPGSRGAGFGPARLDPGLPSQAYRGPTIARAIVAPPPGSAPVYLAAPER